MCLRFSTWNFLVSADICSDDLIFCRMMGSATCSWSLPAPFDTGDKDRGDASAIDDATMDRASASIA